MGGCYEIFTHAALAALILCPALALAQMPAPMHATPSDEDVIKLALSAAPPAVAQDATVVFIDHTGKSQVLHKGAGPFTCLPGHLGAEPDPMCGDKNAMEWAMAWMQHKKPPANKVGFMYMLQGDSGASNTDPYATQEAAGNNWIKTGSHVMWPGTPYEHLMIPVR